MNNLHRDLAPISDAAWGQIEDEARRTFTRFVAGRRVVDVVGPSGVALAAVGTGHLRPIEVPADGVIAHMRDVQHVVELRVPFSVSREAVDDVERGAQDSDWQPVKDAGKADRVGRGPHDPPRLHSGWDPRHRARELQRTGAPPARRS